MIPAIGAGFRGGVKSEALVRPGTVPDNQGRLVSLAPPAQFWAGPFRFWPSLLLKMKLTGFFFDFSL